MTEAFFEAREPEEEDAWPRLAVGRDVTRALGEWLHTNGAGAYASSTLAGMHTRRYHGLLVAALDPPRSRNVVLSHVDTTVWRTHEGNGRPARTSWELGKHQFPGVDPERGPFYLERYDQDPLPRFSYAVGGGTLEITLALVRGRNAAVLRYRWRGAEPVMLTLRPLLALRPFHELGSENGGMLQRVELRVGEVRVQPKRDGPKICFRFDGTFVGSPDWWRRFEYLLERDRGLDFQEDLWTPGLFELSLDASAPKYLVVSVDHLPSEEPAALLEEARLALSKDDPGPSKSRLERRLSVAASAFRADLAPEPSVIAGYPWYDVFGRDALVSLPGLYLVPGKAEQALPVLRAIIGRMRDGLVPTRLSDAGGTPDYHGADATLWLFEAARLVADALGDSHPFVTDALSLALGDAFEAALRGTHFGIGVTPEGLFAAGEANDALTWMDARVDTRPVTPRSGCPVELTALWAKGCETLARLARAAHDQALFERAFAASKKARAAFRARFWCEETRYPFDVVSAQVEGEGAFADASIRPNAVIALAIDPDCFEPEQRAWVLERARSDLLTSAGLRTLTPRDKRYTGRSVGSLSERDQAHYQGAAWPFLLGFYVRAARRAGVPREELLALVESAAASDVCLGHVAEVADGDPPHRRDGCGARAWSAAELLRALAWDLGSGPK